MASAWQRLLEILEDRDPISGYQDSSKDQSCRAYQDAGGEEKRLDDRQIESRRRGPGRR